ncbi:DNA helicase [Fusarium agapanthi]|uniref:DNA helicase n=1 Tax=Fusarium agapanthi TaxID=1803897 RepID=A0A9P5B8L7_9HYPO|nr:DNA helicase [Fusarium agapanthi]
MATTNSATVTEDCAVFFGHHGPLIASGDKIGLRTKIKAQLRSVQAWDCDTWIGLALDFPLGKDQKLNEDAGFGVRYRAPEHGSQDRSKPCDYHQIRIKFPRSFSYQVQQGQSPSTFTNEYLSDVKIYFGEARATIQGFGVPFANQEDHQVESWINGNAPIAWKYHLLDILQQQTLYLVLPAKSSLVRILGSTQNSSTFRYPYSEDFSWDLTRFEKELQENKGQQFAPLYSHPADVSHMIAVSQSIVQDVLWLHQAAERVGLPCSIWKYQAGIRDWDGNLIAKHTRMPGYFFQWSSSISCRNEQDLDKLKMFADRQSASEALLKGDKSWNYVTLKFDFDTDQSRRRIEAAFTFHPQARPFHPTGQWLTTMKHPQTDTQKDTLPDDFSHEQQQLFDEFKDKMDLHRSVLCGSGFYDWMMKTAGNSKWRPLPMIDLVDIDDQTYVNAILGMTLPKYRARFRSYLSSRTMGIGIITGAKVGKILCSGPTDAAVDNFAYRLDRQTREITERLNAGKSLDDSSRYRRKLVVRPYSFNEEINAFYMLMAKPELGKEVLDDWKFPGEPNADVDWKFHLSAAYWLLLLFRSPAVDRSLGTDDSLALHKMQKTIDEDEELEPIRDGFPEAIVEYLDDHFADLLEMLLGEADMLCVTPSTSAFVQGPRTGPYETWKMRLAQGVVVDQAGTMDRPDLYRVWGNTLLPCFLIGDTRSEQSTIQTTNEKEPGSENYYNRFSGDGQLSGLEFLQASGLPVFRLDTQVRMAKGMYDLAAQVFYPQLPLQYHQRDHDITDQQPSIGQELEAYVRMKYPTLRKPPDGILHKPLFIHRQNSTIYKDVDGSQACQEQDSAVLSFISGLVTHSAIDPSQIVILTPWFANAALIERKRNQKRFESLKNMPEAATIESYRGREADIVVVVMSTTRDTGPDITANEHLLITMLTRHKSGLVILGDICTSGVIGEDRNGKLFKINKHGLELNALQRIDETLINEGRVVVFSTKLSK